MKKFMMAMALAATAATPLVATVAEAQTSSRTVKAQREYDREQQQLRQAQYNGDRRDVRKQREDVRQAQRKLQRSQARDWRTYRNYDYNRPEQRGQAYYADQYYRDGRHYQERRLSRNDRVYRGQNGQYYCRRPDGTTGLIVGGIAGGLIGNALDNGRSSTLGTLLGAGAGALLGRQVDRGNVRCR